MFNTLSKLFSRGSRPATIRRPRLGFRPLIEALEGREVPATLLDVTYQGGKLTILGDAGNNTLFFTQQANGLVHLSTEFTGQIRLNGVTMDGFIGTTLNAPITGGVKINMGDGADVVSFSGLNGAVNLPSFLDVDGGDGDNQVNFANGVTVGGDLTIDYGTGMDTTHFYSDVNVLGKLKINNGAGGSKVLGDVTLDLNVAKAMTVKSAAGFDTIDLSTAQKVTLGGLVVNTGKDADGSHTYVSPVEKLTVNGAVLSLSDGSITGKVKVLLGAGTNNLDLKVSADGTLTIGKSLTMISANTDGDSTFLDYRRTTVRGATTILSGAGTDLLEIDDGTFAGKVLINTGVGNDKVDIEQYVNISGVTKFLKPVTILTGRGDDTVRVGGVLPEQGREAIFAAKVTFAGGKGGNDVLKTAQFVNVFIVTPKKVGWEVM